MALTDDFNRANSGTLGANWTDTAAGMGIASNRAAPAGGGYKFARYTGSSWNATHSSQAVIFDDGGGGGDMELTVRHQSNGDLYMLQVNFGSVVARLFKFISSSFTQLGADLSAPTSGHTYKLTVDGTTLEAFDNGVSMGSRTDGDLSGGGPGIGGNATAPATLDDWEGAGEVAAVAATPARILIQKA